MHLFVKKIIDKFDKIQELPTYGGLTVVPPRPLAVFWFFLRVHFIYWLAMPWFTYSADFPCDLIENNTGLLAWDPIPHHHFPHFLDFVFL